jgi:selenocysteine lyase/cysteine desulfurase
LAKAFGETLRPGDEVIVTNQDHEANTGATRRMVEAAGATLREWRVDAITGELHIADLEDLLSSATKLVTFPHCSNIVGAENNVAEICALAKQAGARTIVDGVSYAPHGFSDVGAMGADVYLFSMYKTYSVHQGLMVLRDDLAEVLPNQSHYFNAAAPRNRMAPAGPDHAQVAAAGAVLDYVEATTPGFDGNLRGACEAAKDAWQAHEASLLQPVLRWLDARADIRVIGPTEAGAGMHRCPTVAFVAEGQPSGRLATQLASSGVMASSGDFYATRLIEATGVDPGEGVVRVSWVHYTSPADIDYLLNALEQALA